MFENMVKFLKKFNKKESNMINNSKEAAKERLHLVLMQDRANVSADFLELMKQEIIDVIKKYIDVDENAIDVRLTNKENADGTNGAPALYANIPILNIKNEARKIDSKKQEEKKSVENNNENNKKETEKKDNEINSEKKIKDSKSESLEKNKKVEEKKSEERKSDVIVDNNNEKKEKEKENDIITDDKSNEEKTKNNQTEKNMVKEENSVDNTIKEKVKTEE